MISSYKSGQDTDEASLYNLLITALGVQFLSTFGPVKLKTKKIIFLKTHPTYNSASGMR